MTLIADLERSLGALDTAGLRRKRRTLESATGARVEVDGRRLIAFASNDYLGLANHPDVVAAARDGAARWGAGAGASHLVCGHFAPHAALEAELAAFVRPAAGAGALTFSSGYLANLAILTALAGRSDAIFADRLNHACLNDGALLSRAEFIRYPHGDVAALARRLAASRAKRKVIATDAVFSMDGDIAPLPAMLALAEEFDAWLVVDDAHGFGVLGEGDCAGRGTLAQLGLESDRIVYMGTLGKAAGVAGAFVAAHPAVIETLVQTARSYAFTTAPPPFLAEALRASLKIIAGDHARRAHLFDLVDRFRERMHVLPWALRESRTPIQPLVVGANAAAVELAGALWDRGFWVPAIRPPTVPVGTARLRITLTAAHTRDDVDALVDALADLAPGFASALMAPPEAALRAASPQGASALGRPGGALYGPPEAALRAASPQGASALGRPGGALCGPPKRRFRGGHPLHVEATGEGPPLVLLHGWAMHSEMWGPLLPRLARTYRVHAVDLPGHGHSAAPAEFTLDGVVSALASAFASSAQPLTVLGWSLGGQVAMRWALTQPRQVSRIVLVATSPRFVAGDDWPHAMSDETLVRFGDELRASWKLTMERFLTLQLKGGEHSRATLSALRGRIFARGAPSPAALFGALAMLRSADLRREIAGIAQPALVVSGDRDTLALPGAGRFIAEALPNGTFALIAGAAHLPFVSHGDAFAGALDAFLDAR